MRYPEFCEGQLQALYNTEFSRLWPHRPPGYFPPDIPALLREKLLGWDTGFNLPWLGRVSPNNKFCNFFIQYKLSHLCDHRSSGEYHDWNEPYFRFMVPYLTQNYGGTKHAYSWHQFQALRRLSEEGFAVYYATNSTLSQEELFQWAVQGQITQMNPLLNVGDLHRQHRYVTFTKDSDYFLLHSEVSKASILTHDIVMSQVLESRRSSLLEDLRLLPLVLSKYPGFEDNYLFYVREYKAESVQGRWLILHYVVCTLLNITWNKLTMPRPLRGA